MRVLFLVTGYPSKNLPSAGIFHKTQAEALARLGVEVDVVAPVPAVPPGFQFVRRRWRDYQAIPPRYGLDDVQIYRPRYLHWPLRPHLGPGEEASFRRAAIRVLNVKPDLVHAHFAYPPGLAAVTLARRLRIPSVLTLHGTDVNADPELSRGSRARFAASVRAAGAVIAVSEALAERTVRLTQRRPVVIPIGVRLETFGDPPSRDDARRRLGLPPEPALVAYIGHLGRGKGLIEFLEALKRLVRDGVRGIVVGKGPLQSAVEVAEGVQYLGPQPNERVSLFMAAADILVLPSYSEGLPTVLVEAGAVGTPVIATEVGGIPELLGCGRGVLIPPRSVAALVDAIRAVLGDRDAAVERAASLNRYVYEMYDADRNAARLLDVYRALL